MTSTLPSVEPSQLLPAESRLKDDAPEGGGFQPHPAFGGLKGLQTINDAIFQVRVIIAQDGTNGLFEELPLAVRGREIETKKEIFHGQIM